jgi:hypothetical protein
MAVTITYGTFSFTSGEPEVTTAEEYEFSPSGCRELRKVRIDISGQIQGTNLAAVADALRTAVQVDDQDFTVTNGTDVVNHLSYYHSSCIMGPRVESLSFPEGSGPELATGGIRTYRMSVAAHVELANPTYGDVMSWRETVTTEGGRPVYQVQEVINGDAEIWPTQGKTAYRCRQEGEAMGRNTWPTPPKPKWPGLRIDNNEVVRESPEYVQLDADGSVSTARRYRIRWSYEYAAPTDAFSTAEPREWYPV